MQRKGLYYELVTAQSEKEKEKEVDDEKENDLDEALGQKLVESSKHRTRRMSLMLRRTSIVSVKSTTSETLSELAHDATMIDDTEKKSCCSMPVLFQVLGLNSPEWFYLLIGGIASLIYGAVMPVCKPFINRSFSHY